MCAHGTVGSVLLMAVGAPVCALGTVGMLAVYLGCRFGYVLGVSLLVLSTCNSECLYFRFVIME